MKITTKKDMDIYQVSLMHNYTERVDCLSYIRRSTAACAFDTQGGTGNKGDATYFRCWLDPLAQGFKMMFDGFGLHVQVCTAIAKDTKIIEICSRHPRIYFTGKMNSIGSTR